MTTPPTDTAAALWDAIRYAAGDFIREGDERAIDLAIAAHVEAEVARRLAAAPEVEVAIVRHDDATYWRGYRHGGGKVPPDWEDVPRDDHTLRAAIAADKARAVDLDAIALAADLIGRHLAPTSDVARGAVARLEAMLAGKPARPTPDEARRLVAEYTEGIIDYTLSGTTVVAAGHGTAVTGTIGPDPRITSIATARTALLRALGVEA